VLTTDTIDLPGTTTIDLLNSRSYAGGHPHQQYRWLRDNAPAYWHDEPDGPAFWAVTSAALLTEVIKSPHVFSNEAGSLINEFTPEELGFFRLAILMMDPPKHTFYRRLVGRSFTPKPASGQSGSPTRCARSWTRCASAACATWSRTRPVRPDVVSAAGPVPGPGAGRRADLVGVQLRVRAGGCAGWVHSDRTDRAMTTFVWSRPVRAVRWDRRMEPAHRAGSIGAGSSD
jgi:hypothetical protein